MYHPDVTLAHAHDRQRELIAQAEQHRLVSAVRRRGRADAVPRGRPSAVRGYAGAGVAAPA